MAARLAPLIAVWSITGQTISVSAITVGPQGVGEGPLDRSGLYAELVGDLAAVDDERLGELVLHLDQFPHRGVDQTERAQHYRRKFDALELTVMAKP